MNNNSIIFIILVVIIIYGFWKLNNYDQKKTIIDDVIDIIKQNNKK